MVPGGYVSPRWLKRAGVAALLRKDPMLRTNMHVSKGEEHSMMEILDEWSQCPLQDLDFEW
jgi:hypothetical protein